MSAVITGVMMKRHRRRLRRSVTGRGLAGQHALLDQLVRPYQERLRNRESERLGGLEIDDQLERRRLLDGKVGGLGAT